MANLAFLKRKCGNCRWFLDHRFQLSNCVESSPMLNVPPQHSVFPKIHALSHCGKWKPMVAAQRKTKNWLANYEQGIN